MSILSVYDINSFIKADSEIQTLAGKEISIFPAIAYGDEAAPFIIYYYSPIIPDVEAFWNRVDNVSYLIYDTDIDRMMNIGERIMELLGKGDQISQPGGKAGTDVRILSTVVNNAAINAPNERDGWYSMELEFDIHHVKR